MPKLREEVEALVSNRSKHRDFDPEDDYINTNQDDEDDLPTSDDVGGREHYQKVGKSKLRGPQAIPLDRKYGGVAVRRNVLEVEEDEDNDPFAPQDDEGDDDPFGKSKPVEDDESSEEVELEEDVNGIDEDDSIDSDEAFGDSDEGKFDHFTFRGSKKNRMSSRDQASDGSDIASDNADDSEDNEDSNLESEVSEGENEEDEEDEGSIASDNSADNAPTSRKREDLKAYLSRETQNLASTLSQAASSDAKKGNAVKQQYHTYDRLLDARIKLQKAHTTTDQLTQNGSDFGTDAREALEKATTAALNLYETIESFRHSIHDASNPESKPKKRKRTALNTDLDGLGRAWTRLQESEREAQTSRRTTLEKWSQKIKASDPTQAIADRRSKFLDASADSRLTTILDTYILNEQDKHFYDPTTAEDNDGQHENTRSEADVSTFKYDDSLFYQSLLRDLITTRAATNSTGANGLTPVLPHRLHPSGNRQNKNVRDTKASKGRKIRYTVHEKLQNFMAAEGDTGRDTAMWTERGKNEFFGSLFGQDRALAEDDDEVDVVMEDGEDGQEVEALRLFRS